MAWTHGYSLLGFVVSGDLDGTTIYTDRYGRKISFPHTTPLDPPTPIQIWQRERFRAAMAEWKSLSDAERDQYKIAVDRLSLCMSCTSLWVGLACRKNDSMRLTIERQADVTLRKPTHV
jgi:hypothetical protein